MERLTRENRYEPAGLAAAFDAEGHPLRDWQKPVKVLRCRSCGSLLLSGDEDIHERLHQPPSCDRVHPGMAVHCFQPHAWEDQFGPD